MLGDVCVRVFLNNRIRVKL